MWPLIGKFLYDVAVGVTVTGVSGLLFGDSSPKPTVITHTYPTYYPSPPAKTIPVNKTFVIVKPPPGFNKDSAVAAYTRQFESIQLPVTVEDFLTEKYYTGGSQEQGASLHIKQVASKTDRIEFGYRLMLTEQTFEGKGYYLPKTGEINLGLEDYGIKPGLFGKFRHMPSKEILTFIYLQADSEKEELKFINNGKP